MDEREKLKALGKHVHLAVRGLKIGDTGTVTCGKEYPQIEVRQYLIAYAFYKHKWFEMKHDAVGDVIYAERVIPPSFLPPVEEPDDQEEM